MDPFGCICISFRVDWSPTSTLRACFWSLSQQNVCCMEINSPPRASECESIHRTVVEVKMWKLKLKINKRRKSAEGSLRRVSPKRFNYSPIQTCNLINLLERWGSLIESEVCDNIENSIKNWLQFLSNRILRGGDKEGFEIGASRFNQSSWQASLNQSNMSWRRKLSTFQSNPLQSPQTVKTLCSSLNVNMKT